MAKMLRNLQFPIFSCLAWIPKSTEKYENSWNCKIVLNKKAFLKEKLESSSTIFYNKVKKVFSANSFKDFSHSYIVQNFFFVNSQRIVNYHDLQEKTVIVPWFPQKYQSFCNVLWKFIKNSSIHFCKWQYSGNKHLSDTLLPK